MNDTMMGVALKITKRPRTRPSDYLRYLPGIVLGVFLARVLGEWVGLPAAWVAVVLSLALAASGGWLLAHWPFDRTWPALISLAYILYPEPYPLLALQVAAVALVAGRHNRRPSRGGTLAPGRLTSVIPPVLVGVAAFALYLVTLAPDVLAADSGELQVIAAQLGVAHPPGFPLYVMVAHLVIRLLPFVSPAYAANLFSAVTSALTIPVVYISVKSLTGRDLPAIIASIALATATTFWSQATTANVRSLTGLFAALIVLALLLYRSNSEQNDREKADRWLALAALLMGFGLTHHVSLLFLVTVGLVFVVMVDRTLLATPQRWIRPLIAALLGLAPLLYLPLRATAAVRGASQDLATWPGFLEHALATGFRGDLFYYLAPADLWQRLRIMGNVLAFQFEPVVLIGIAVALIVLIWWDRKGAVLLGGTFAAYTFVAATYRAPQTVEYMIPAYVVAAIMLGYAVARLSESQGWGGERNRRWGWIGRGVSVLFPALVMVSALGQIPNHLSASGAEHEASAARDYAEPLLTAAPTGSIILAHWHWATPLWYLQEVENKRPDVDVRFVFPVGEAYEATWERRAREAFDAGRPVITTWIPATQPGGLPVPEPIGEAVLFPQGERMDMPPDFTPAVLVIGDLIEVLAYHVNLPDATLSPGEEVVITIAWRPARAAASVSALFVHLVGDDGEIYGQDDRPAGAAGGSTLTQFRATPRPGTPLGRLTVYAGASGTGGTFREELTRLDTKPSASAAFTRNRVDRRLLGAISSRLVGYDWDHTVADRSRLYLHWQTDEGYFTQVVDDAAIDSLMLDLYRGPWGVPVENWRFPRGRDGGHYVPLGEGIVWTGETLNGLSLTPGESIIIDTELHNSRPLNRDYVVSVRLIGLEPDGNQWAWWDLRDSIPAMGAIPTLKWVDGSFVRSPHRVKVDETAESGQALTGALTLYDAFTNRPLPILDERMTAENPWIPLCRAIVARE